MAAERETLTPETDDTSDSTLFEEFNGIDTEELHTLLPYKDELTDSQRIQIVDNAIFLRNFEKLELFISAGFLTPDQEMTLLLNACDKRYRESGRIIKIILNSGHIPKLQQVELFTIDAADYYDKAVFLVQNGLSVDVQENALQRAILTDQKKTVTALLKNGLIPRSSKANVLQNLAIQCNTTAVERFLETGLHEKAQVAALQNVIARGHRNSAKILLDSKKISVPAQEEMLEEAIKKNCPSVISFFSENNRISASGEKVYLKKALLSQRTEIVDIFLKSASAQQEKMLVLRKVLIRAAKIDDTQMVNFYIHDIDPEYISLSMLNAAILTAEQAKNLTIREMLVQYRDVLYSVEADKDLSADSAMPVDEKRRPPSQTLPSTSPAKMPTTVINPSRVSSSFDYRPVSDFPSAAGKPTLSTEEAEEASQSAPDL